MILRENGGKKWKEWIESVPPSFISISKRLATLETLLSLYLSIYPPHHPLSNRLPSLPGAEEAAAVLRFSTFSRFIPAASSLNRFPGEIYGRAIIHWSVGGGGGWRKGGWRRGERLRERWAHHSRHVRSLLSSSSSSSPPD